MVELSYECLRYIEVNIFLNNKFFFLWLVKK